MSSENWAFETKQIHVGQNVDGDTGARALPIYQTTSFVFDSAETAANRFGLSDLGPIYTRIGNPTAQAVEDRIAALEGGVGALLLASGQAATTFAILNVAQAGDHIVASSALYGGTYNLLHYTFPKLGIDVSFVDDPDDPQSWRDAVRPNTKLFFAESTANPLADILDVPAVAAVAHEEKVPFVVDNTVPTAALIRPLELGADVVVASLTKFYTGNSTGIGGIAIDGGTFDWTVTRDEQPIGPVIITARTDASACAADRSCSSRPDRAASAPSPSSWPSRSARPSPSPPAARKSSSAAANSAPTS